MNRIRSFDRKYKANGSAVRSSIAKVAAAGRFGDPNKIGAERARHRKLMASLP
jgi:hypothetical protein